MVEKNVTDRFARRQWRIRQISLSALVVLELLALFVAMPLSEMGVLASPVYYFIMTMLIVAAVAVVSRSRVSLTAILIAFVVALAANLFRHESRSMLVNYLLRGGVGICNRADVGRWPSRVRPWTGNVSSDPGRHCFLSPYCRDIRLLLPAAGLTRAQCV
jgi:hypothetical protein